MRLSWAAATHPGLRRAVNEDSYGVRPEIGLFVVADGMGGHAAGDVASRVAVEAIEAFIAETAGADEHSTWPFPLDPAVSLEANRLRMAFQVANRRIADAVTEDPSRRGMATTASAVLVAPPHAVIAHVGDSRVYRLPAAGPLERLTRDHSWVEDQVRAGALSSREAQSHPWRNIVTKALGGIEAPVVDLVEVDLAPGDRLLLCSDGLSGFVAEDRIAAVAGGPELPGTCDALVEAANAAGGPDNVTAVILQVDAE